MPRGSNNTVDKEIKPIKTFAPIGAFVALELLPLKKRTIALPEGVEHPNQAPLARVIAAGPKCEQIKDEDIVILNPTMCINVWFKGMKYTILNEEHVIGVMSVPIDGVLESAESET